MDDFSIPDDQLSQAALSEAKKQLHPAILNHSLRVFHYARALAKSLAENPSLAGFPAPLPSRSEFEYEVGTSPSSSQTRTSFDSYLFVACIYHDLGACEAYNGDQRFEVEAADAAYSLIMQCHQLQPLELALEAARQVWLAIALHTSPGIGERASKLCQLVRLGVLCDFRSNRREELGLTVFGDRLEECFPRLEVELLLSNEVVRQAVGKGPENSGERLRKAPNNSWPGSLCRWAEQNPSSEGVNKAF
ncbi:hypothetical protein VKT23_020705 [Stygiomarasmius scandens]|uniref:HD/PDEase domain-containing protein n=1 Tax=Marasmiellus scandens TaxID=2682957 RepID=A0ABR1ILZ7_9AGAR